MAIVKGPGRVSTGFVGMYGTRASPRGRGKPGIGGTGELNGRTLHIPRGFAEAGFSLEGELRC